MKRFALSLGLVAAAAVLVACSGASAPSAAPSAAGPTGPTVTVVAKDVKRGTVVTASATGTARTVRTAKARSLALGQRLDVRGTALADGTFKAVSLRGSGRATTTRLKAVVVRDQAAQRRLIVSAGGSTFALRRAKAARPAAVTRPSASSSCIRPMLTALHVEPGLRGVNRI